jgi:hypothetical protein
MSSPAGWRPRRDRQRRRRCCRRRPARRASLPGPQHKRSIGIKRRLIRAAISR